MDINFMYHECKGQNENEWFMWKMNNDTGSTHKCLQQLFFVLSRDSTNHPEHNGPFKRFHMSVVSFLTQKSFQMPLLRLIFFCEIVQLISKKWIKNLFIFVAEQKEQESFSLHFSARLNILKPCCEKAFLLSLFLVIWLGRKVIEMEFGLEICRVFQKPQKTPQLMYTNTHIGSDPFSIIHVFPLLSGKGDESIFLEWLI